VGPDPVNSRLLAEIESFFSQSADSAFIVGGYLRDCLLGRTPEDIDLAVTEDSLVTGQALAEYLHGHFVVLDSENHMARIILPDTYQNISKIKHVDLNFIQKDIFSDLARRDFTINAMAIPVSKAAGLAPGTGIPDIIDPYQGSADISRRTVSAVSSQVFENDGLRLLRCIRLSQELGFQIDENTISLIKQYSHCIRNIAGERVREELLRLFKLGSTGNTVIELDRLGILEGIVPELIPCKTTQQPKEHHWDVFGHSVKCIDAADFLLRRGEWPYADNKARELAPWNNHLQDYFESQVSADSNRRQLLKIAALLHDIAKPDTRTITEDGRIRFYGHPAQGEPITHSILTRLRFSAKECRMTAGLTKHHLRPVQMNQRGQLPTDRAIYRYLRDTGDIAVDTLFLSLADHLAARGPALEPGFWADHCRIATMVIEKLEEMKKSKKAPGLINGHDLLDNFKLSPGPVIKTILAAIAEAQAVGDITSRSEALGLAREIIEKLDLPTVDSHDYRQGKGIIKP